MTTLIKAPAQNPGHIESMFRDNNIRQLRDMLQFAIGAGADEKKIGLWTTAVNQIDRDSKAWLAELSVRVQKSQRSVLSEREILNACKALILSVNSDPLTLTWVSNEKGGIKSFYGEQVEKKAKALIRYGIVLQHLIDHNTFDADSDPKTFSRVWSRFDASEWARYALLEIYSSQKDPE